MSLGKGEAELSSFEGRKVTVTEPQGRGWCPLARDRNSWAVGGGDQELHFRHVQTCDAHLEEWFK